jgi:transposase-like protein
VIFVNRISDLSFVIYHVIRETGFKPVLILSYVKMAKRKRVAVKRKIQVVKRTRKSYSVEHKKEVIAYARNHGNNQAARHFDIDRGMVSRWVSASSKWTSETKKKSKRVGSGRKALFPEAEKRLYTWIIQQRKQGLAVTYITIRSKMLEILKEPEMVVLYGNVGEDFKMSQRWILGFMKRFNLALHRRTRIFQKLPDKTQE